MPIREYECQRCGHVWEKLNPQGQQQCPECKSTEAKQLFSACNWNWGGLFLHWNEEKED